MGIPSSDRLFLTEPCLPGGANYQQTDDCDVFEDSAASETLAGAFLDGRWLMPMTALSTSPSVNAPEQPAFDAMYAIAALDVEDGVGLVELDGFLIDQQMADTAFGAALTAAAA